jgi:hypothetical protein
MITRHHLSLVFICTLMLGIMVFPRDLPLLCILVTGSCIGTLLPDVQIKVSANRIFLMPAWFLTRFSTLICIPVMRRIYHTLNYKIPDRGDKRLTHSIPGILIIALSIAVLSAVPVIVDWIAPVPLFAVVFSLGATLGLVLHLVEDACTRKGIAPLFPFSTIRISGSIRPCDKADSRIAQYHFHHCSVAMVIIVLHLLGVWPQSASVLLGLFALSSCLAVMIWLSDVRIETCCLPKENSRTAYPVPKNFTKRIFIPARKDREA